MTEIDSQDESRPQATGHLTYRDGREDGPTRQKFVLDLAAGLVLSVVLVALCGFIWVISNLDLGPPRNPRPPIEWRFPLAANLVILMPLGARMLWARRRGNRGFVMGALIGLAASGLMEGLCFHRP